MKTLKYIIAVIVSVINYSLYAQTEVSRIERNTFIETRLTIEPGIGIKPGPTSPSPGILLSDLVQFNFTKRFHIISHTSLAYNNAFLREFNFVETDYNYTLSQKFGAGISFYGKRSSHNFSMIAGIVYDNFKETLRNPEFESISVSVSSVRPDVGLMYNLKLGQKKYFFSYRMYLPLYPYPFKSSDVNTIDGNIANVTLEAGVGIRIK